MFQNTEISGQVAFHARRLMTGVGLDNVRPDTHHSEQCSVGLGAFSFYTST